MAVTKICCIGAGYVGGPICSIIAMQCPHIKVTVVDKSVHRISQWNSEKLPIYEPGLDDIVKKRINVNLFFSTNTEEAIQEADLIFIAVNTPTKTFGEGEGHATDLTYIENCARTIAEVSTRDKIVVEKSTVPVGTAESILKILSANHKPNVKFHVLSNPEFLSEGEAVENLLNPDRVIIGHEETADGLWAFEELRKVYLNWIPEVKRLDLTVVVNFLQQVLEINEFQKFRFAMKVINSLLGTISDRAGLSKLNDSELYFTNPEYYSKARLENLPLITGKKITMFGFAFKRGTGDTRESPAIHVAKILLDEGVKLSIYDPKVEPEQIKKDLIDYPYVIDTPENVIRSIEIHNNPYIAADMAQAIVICTGWDEFVNLDYEKIYERMIKPAFIFDGCKILNDDILTTIGFQVYTIGKVHSTDLTGLSNWPEFWGLNQLASKAYLAQRISFINAISALCEESGTDVSTVAVGIGLDSRIGPEFLQASVGFGGIFSKTVEDLSRLSLHENLPYVSCYFNNICKKVIDTIILPKRSDLKPYIMDPEYCLKVRRENLLLTTGKKITMFGFAFEKGTYHIHRSPAIHVAKMLLGEGVKLNIYDGEMVDPEQMFNEIDFHPYVIHIPENVFRNNIEIYSDPYAAADSTHAIVICTGLDEFVNLDYEKIYERMIKPAFIFDGCNILNDEILTTIGFQVYTIGKC